MRFGQQQARARGGVLGVRDAGGGSVHGARSLLGLYPTDSSLRVWQIPTQESAHTVRRYRHPC